MNPFLPCFGVNGNKRQCLRNIILPIIDEKIPTGHIFEVCRNYDYYFNFIRNVVDENGNKVIFKTYPFERINYIKTHFQLKMENVCFENLQSGDIVKCKGIIDNDFEIKYNSDLVLPSFRAIYEVKNNKIHLGQYLSGKVEKDNFNKYLNKEYLVYSENSER